MTDLPTAIDDVATIGYYVHHHGAGHAARFSAVAAHCASNLVALSEIGIDGAVRLTTDVPPTDVALDPTAGGTLHWAPTGWAGSADRAQTIVDWIARTHPAGMVVDVSVEAALLARLCGLATIVVRQHGDRDDDVHRLAYGGATRLLAPFPEELEHPTTPRWIRDATTYCGFIGPTPDPTRVDDDRRIPGRDDIVVVWGRGGGALDRRSLDALADSHPEATVWILGDVPPVVPTDDSRFVTAGFVDDPRDFLVDHPLVVASAGNNAVADAAVSGCALIVCPQVRPFDEQVRHAEALDAAGVAAVVRSDDDTEIDPDRWRTAAGIARTRRDRLASLAADGAATAARTIDDTFGHPPVTIG